MKKGYEEIYGLVESPFSVTPNPRFLFESHSHTAAFEQVMLAIRRREAVVVVTGEIGTGKTLLCRTIIHRLPPRTFLSVITNSFLGIDDLLKQILADFGILSSEAVVAPGATRHDLIRALQQFVVSLVPLQAHAVIVIDEAQHLRADVLEQVRLLSNFETDDGKLLQFILVGQPDLETLLGRPEMRQLEQRVSRRCRLQPLHATEVQQYIDRHLWVSHGGAPADAAALDLALPADDDGFWRVRFTPAAVKTIADLSRGVPRVINVLCDRALEAGAATGSEAIDAEAVLEAAREMKIPVSPFARLRTRRYATAAAAVPIVVVAGGWALGVVRNPLVRHANAPVSRPAQPTSSAAGQATSSAAHAAGSTQASAPAQTAAPHAETLQVADSFTVVAASFKTPTRAAAVAAEASALGLPAFTRVVGGEWQQVTVGPYATRSEAETAQRKLSEAGFAGTRIAVEAANR